MRRLTPGEYRRMPWRNGGGTTTEITIAPEGADLPGGRFLYRVSIADVAADGPFSRFVGYDRHIVLLGGAGMTLDGGPDGPIDLLAPFEPQAFSGDWDVSGHLVAGAVRDFNVIADRARATATLEAPLLEAATAIDCPSEGVCIIHVVEGQLVDAAEGDTLVADEPVRLVPRALARLAIARISIDRAFAVGCSP